MTRTFLGDQLKRVSAAGIRSFKQESADILFNELRELPESHIKKAIDQLLQLEDIPRNLVGFILRVSKENSQKVPGKNPDKWWIVGGHCFRCADSGSIPELFWAEKDGQKTSLNGDLYFATRLWECNCAFGKKFSYFDENKKQRIYIGRQYSEKYGDDFQFPFTKELLFSDPYKKDYPYVFMQYEQDFIRRFKENKKAEFLETDLTGAI